jgi:hypothetical protein
MSLNTPNKDPLIKLLEEERAKYDSDDHEPTKNQIKQFNFLCKLIKEDPTSLKQRPCTTRYRRWAARENLEKISSLGASVFTLCCFSMNITVLVSKTYLQLIPKLQRWWDTVAHPKQLAVLARMLCDAKGLNHIQDIHSMDFFSFFNSKRYRLLSTVLTDLLEAPLATHSDNTPQTWPQHSSHEVMNPDPSKHIYITLLLNNNVNNS